MKEVEEDSLPRWEDADYAKLQPILFGQAIFQTLVAACRFELFTHLSQKPGQTREELARAMAIPEHSARVLLLACCSIGLLSRRGEQYFNDPTSERLLVKGKPNNALAFVWSGQYLQYQGFYHLAESLKEGRNVGLQMYPGEGKSIYERMSHNREIELVLYEVMKTITELSHRSLDDKLELREARHLVDVAGGSGKVADMLTGKYPQMRVTVFDRPTAAELARKYIEQVGKQNRIDTLGGDVFTDPFPKGPDAFFFARILETQPRDVCVRLLRKAVEALPTGGRAFCWGFAANNEETSALYAARLSLYFLCNATGAGMAYPSKEVEGWFREAGFGQVRSYVDLPFEHCLVVGTKL